MSLHVWCMWVGCPVSSLFVRVIRLSLCSIAQVLWEVAISFFLFLQVLWGGDNDGWSNPPPLAQCRASSANVCCLRFKGLKEVSLSLVLLSPLEEEPEDACTQTVWKATNSEAHTHSYSIIPLCVTCPTSYTESATHDNKQADTSLIPLLYHLMLMKSNKYGSRCKLFILPNCFMGLICWSSSNY